MRNTNCRNAKREIEEAASAELLSAGAQRHLTTCTACDALLREQISLRELVGSLETVAAPGDFDFRLRARLAREHRQARAFAPVKFSFSLRFASVVTILLLFASALMFLSFRDSSNHALKVAQVAPARMMDQPETKPQAGVDQTASGTLSATSEASMAIVTPGSATRRRSARNEAAAGESGRQEARDFSGTRAPVFRADRGAARYQTAAFQIEGGYQSVKVSVDEGRGTSRTISLPAVSFGSQPSLSQSPAPLLASARDAW
jgi:hypothetical protein